MPDDQVAPDVDEGLATDSTSEVEQTEVEVEEQSDEQTDEHTSEETSEESELDQLRTQLEQSNTNNADMRTQLDALNRTFTQQRQEEAEQRRHEEPKEDYTQFGDQGQAVQALDERIASIVGKALSAQVQPLSEQLQDLTGAQKQKVNIAAAIARNPGVSEKAIMDMYNNPNMTTEDIIAQALSGKTAAKTATAQTKKNVERKQKANTGTQKGGSPKDKGLGWVYDSSNPEHVAMTASEIMQKSQENYHE